MAYAEERGGYWRGRWRGPDGKLETSPAGLRFTSRDDAVEYARDQEAAIRLDVYEDPRAGSITVGEWVNEWFPSLDLEASTLENYRYHIEVLILPTFADVPLRALTPQRIGKWEMELPVEKGTARRARSLLTNLLNAAMPQHIKFNPAARRKGTGKKGQRRIEQAQQAEKIWTTPLEALLLAERASVLSGEETDFVMLLTKAYTGARWSEVIGLKPGKVKPAKVKLNWKLYELDGHFYGGAPKAGSIRDADLPPFLSELLATYIDSGHGQQRCTCEPNPELNNKINWCQGGEYVFLTPGGEHFRRSNYSERTFRPSADGFFPGREGKRPRPIRPVLVDASAPWPGRPVQPWPVAVPGVEFVPPMGRGVLRLASGNGRGRCSECLRHLQLKLDGTLINHGARNGHCPGSLKQPAEDIPAASWLPVLRGVTPHGLRHGHESWLEDAELPYPLIADRMGHEVQGMRKVYSHVSPGMRRRAVKALQKMWKRSLRERRKIADHSAVPLLDALLRAV